MSDDDRYTPEVQAILDKVKTETEGKTYTLTYIAHDDQLDPKQVAGLLRGENPYESSLFSDLEQYADDAAYDGAIEELKDILDLDEYAILDDPENGDAKDEARSMVQDNDSSDMITDTFKNTQDLLMRYNLDLDVNTNYSSGEDDYTEQIAAIIEHLALAQDHPVRGQLMELLANAPYGGRLWVLWFGSPYQVAEQAMQAQKARMGEGVKPATITFGAGAHLLVLDQWNGSGFTEELGAPLTVAFNSEKITTDADGNGYGWDQIAGVHQPAYAADVTITKED